MECSAIRDGTVRDALDYAIGRAVATPVGSIRAAGASGIMRYARTKKHPAVSRRVFITWFERSYQLR
ncbi:hypothetical protein TM233_01980 [Bradyrhizobium sp. TM233]|nr:hypothetical protein TM233_01980 [Bradyrhizobium sp. TM233]